MIQTHVKGCYGMGDKTRHLSCYLIGEGREIAIDTGAFPHLTSEELLDIHTSVITHTHSDHTMGIDQWVYWHSLEDQKAEIVAPRHVIDGLKSNVFNRSVFPPFHDFPGKGSDGKMLTLTKISPEKSSEVGNYVFIPVPVDHHVGDKPRMLAYGYVVQEEGALCFFGGDSGPMPTTFWQKLVRDHSPQAFIIDCNYTSDMEELANTYKHHTPALIKTAWEAIGAPIDVRLYATHLRPDLESQIREEIHALANEGVPITAFEQDKTYELVE